MPNNAWFDDFASLYLFERDARRELGSLQRHEVAEPRRLVYEMTLNVPVYDEPRRVRIEFAATSPAEPRVFADGDGTSPHRYDDGSLCMYFPHDPPGWRWIPSDGLAALLDCVRTHLFQEAELAAGRGWPGDEAPHGLVQSQRRRR